PTVAPAATSTRRNPSRILPRWEDRRMRRPRTKPFGIPLPPSPHRERGGKRRRIRSPRPDAQGQFARQPPPGRENRSCCAGRHSINSTVAQSPVVVLAAVRWTDEVPWPWHGMAGAGGGRPGSRDDGGPGVAAALPGGGACSPRDDRAVLPRARAADAGET